MKNLFAQLLNEKDISIRELSKRTNKSYAQTHETVRAETLNSRTLEILVQIAKAIGCQVTDLYEEEKEMTYFVVESDAYRCFAEVLGEYTNKAVAIKERNRLRKFQETKNSLRKFEGSHELTNNKYDVVTSADFFGDDLRILPHTIVSK